MAYTQESLQNLSNKAFTLAAQGKVPNLLTKSQKTSFSYPLASKDKTNDFLLIKIFDYVDGDFNLGPPLQAPTASQRIKKSKILPRYYIQLPIPQALSDISAVSWGQDSLNPIQAGLVGGISDTIEDPRKAFEAVVDNIKNMEGITQSQKKALNQYIAAQAANLLNANVNAQSLISRNTGQVLQSNLELLFEGVTLRSFPFTFDFSPRYDQESNEVKNIIRILKKTMAARSRVGSGTNSNLGLFMQSPSLYQLEYRSGNGPHKFLHRFKPCALTNISLNYTGSNTYATYQDGTPVHIQMSLTFNEINPIYAEDYDTNESGEGVGY